MSAERDPGLGALNRRPDLEWAELDGEVVVFDQAGMAVHLLNPSAARVWCRLDGVTTVGEVASWLADEHRADEDLVRRDVETVLVDLDELGLLSGSTPEAECSLPGPAPEDPPPPTPPAPPSSKPPRAYGLARLGTYRALGLDFVVDTDGVEGAGLVEMLQPLGGPEPAQGRPLTRITIARVGASAWPLQVWIGEEPIGTIDSPDRLAEHLLWQIVHRAVASVPGGPVLHAAAAASSDRGVLLPGPSGAGKSTLVAALVEHGLTYLGDEAIGLDLHDRVLLPLPKPVKLDVAALELFSCAWAAEARERASGSSRHIPPDRIRAGSVSGPVSLAAVVLPGHEPAESTCLEPIPRSAALTTLTSQVFAPGLSREDFPGLVELVRAVPAYRVSGDDLASTCRLVEELLTAPGR